jgi:hypothetical protein
MLGLGGKEALAQNNCGLKLSAYLKDSFKEFKSYGKSKYEAELNERLKIGASCCELEKYTANELWHSWSKSKYFHHSLIFFFSKYYNSIN